MKQILMTIGLVCLVAFSWTKADAGDVLQPPKDLRSLIGKTLVFEDGSHDNTFVCSIVGASRYRESMGEGVVLFLTGLDYHGETIHKISYMIGSSQPEKWELTYANKTQKITVKSIE